MSNENFNNQLSLVNNSNNITHNESQQNNLTDDELNYLKLQVIRWLMLLCNNRTMLIQVKLGLPFDETRSIAAENITAVERNYCDSLEELYHRFALTTLFENIYENCIQNSVIWNIMKKKKLPFNADISPNVSGLPDVCKIERDIANTMINVASKNIFLNEACGKFQKEIVDNLEAIKLRAFKLEKVRLFKEQQYRNKNNSNDVEISLKKNIRNNIFQINTINSLISGLINLSQINYFENPQIVEIIKETRHTVTEDSIQEEALKIVNFPERKLIF